MIHCDGDDFRLEVKEVMAEGKLLSVEIDEQHFPDDRDESVSGIHSGV
jgi:hypothetical protein